MPDGTQHPIEADLLTKGERAIGFSITANLDGNRQIVFQALVREGDDLSEQNAFLDRVMLLADRQRARYRIKELAEELETRVKALARFEFDKAQVELTHQHGQAARQEEIKTLRVERDSARDAFQATMDAEILKIQGARAAEYQEGLDAHRRTGRGGSYVPNGSRKANIEHIDQRIAQLTTARDIEMANWDKGYDEALAKAEAEFVRVEADRRQHADGLEETLKRHREGVEVAQRDLAEIKALAEG